MSASREPSARLASLEQILAQSPPVTHGSAATDPGQVHLASIPLERIAALTRELQEHQTLLPDSIDAIAIRLLLNEYKAAVAHLRAVSNGVDARLHTVSEQLQKSRKTVRRDEEMAAKRARTERGLID